jgi:hypothetical protein
MAENTSTIDKLLKEHEDLNNGLNVCQVSVDDLAISEKVNTAEGILTPGRLEDHRKKAYELEKELMRIEENLRDHFTCEEKSLLEDFRKRKIDRLVGILGELIAQHEDMLGTLAELRKDVSELATSGASVAAWNNKAWQVRPVMSKLSSTIKAHANQENALYKEAKEVILKQEKKKSS